MYMIIMDGLSVSVAGPNGETYRFAGYGDFDMIITPEELAAVCTIMRAAGQMTTTATLTDAVTYLRTHPVAQGQLPATPKELPQ